MIQGLAILVVGGIGTVMSIGVLIYWCRNSVDKMLLGSFVLLLSLLVLTMAVVGMYADWNHPFINLTSLLFYVFLLFIPPTMYLYVDHYLNEESLDRTLWRNLSYFMLPIGLLIVNLSAFVVIYSSAEDSIYTTISAEVITYANFIALVFIFLLQNIYFIYKGVSRYRQYERELDEVFSSTEGIVIQRWIKTFLLGYIIFIIMVYLRQIVGTGDFSFAGLFLSYIGFMIYKGVRHPSFAATLQAASKKAEGNAHHNDSWKPHATSSTSLKLLPSTSGDSRKKLEIPKDVQQEIWARVQILIQEEKVYLDTGITLYALAKMASTNSKYLRFIIKERAGKSFSSYINSYRVEEAKRKLLSEDSTLYTMDSIGEMSGFKSKSAFYQTFKEFTGNTPKQYQDKR